MHEEEAFIRHYWDIFEETVNFYRELSSGEALHRRQLFVVIQSLNHV